MMGIKIIPPWYFPLTNPNSSVCEQQSMMEILNRSGCISVDSKDKMNNITLT